MQAEIAQFQANYLQLSQHKKHKKLSTGQALEPPILTAWPQAVNSDETFRKLVSETYKLWHEQWGEDVGFLLNKRPSANRARSFDQLLNQLRTAHQHATNDTAILALETWLREACGGHIPATPQNWTKCGQKLMSLLSSATDELVDVAAGVTRNEQARMDWHRRAAESVPAIVELVADDLGLRLNDRDLGYHRRAGGAQRRRFVIRRPRSAARPCDRHDLPHPGRRFHEARRHHMERCTTNTPPLKVTNSLTDRTVRVALLFLAAPNPGRNPRLRRTGPVTATC